MEQRALQYEQNIQTLYDQWFTGGKTLDGGFFLSQLGNRFERYETEIDPKSVEFCKLNIPEFSGNVINLTLEDAKFEDSCFDFVTMRDVIEHVSNPSATLPEVARILKPDGIFFICATPNVSSVAARIYRENWVLFILFNISGIFLQKRSAGWPQIITFILNFKSYLISGYIMNIFYQTY